MTKLLTSIRLERVTLVSHSESQHTQMETKEWPPYQNESRSASLTHPGRKMSQTSLPSVKVSFYDSAIEINSKMATIRKFHSKINKVRKNTMFPLTIAMGCFDFSPSVPFLHERHAR